MFCGNVFFPLSCPYDFMHAILCRNCDGYGVICDMVHSHILQTIALLAMEPPVSLDGEDIRNEKVHNFYGSALHSK